MLPTNFGLAYLDSDCIILLNVFVSLNVDFDSDSYGVPTSLDEF